MVDTYWTCWIMAYRQYLRLEWDDIYCPSPPPPGGLPPCPDRPGRTSEKIDVINDQQPQRLHISPFTLRNSGCNVS